MLPLRLVGWEIDSSRFITVLDSTRFAFMSINLNTFKTQTKSDCKSSLYMLRMLVAVTLNFPKYKFHLFGNFSLSFSCHFVCVREAQKASSSLFLLILVQLLIAYFEWFQSQYVFFLKIKNTLTPLYCTLVYKSW